MAGLERVYGTAFEALCQGRGTEFTLYGTFAANRMGFGRWQALYTPPSDANRLDELALWDGVAPGNFAGLSVDPISRGFGAPADGAGGGVQRLYEMSRGSQLPSFFGVHGKIFRKLEGGGLAAAVALLRSVYVHAGLLSDGDKHDDELQTVCAVEAKRLSVEQTRSLAAEVASIDLTSEAVAARQCRLLERAVEDVMLAARAHA